MAAGLPKVNEDLLDATIESFRVHPDPLTLEQFDHFQRQFFLLASAVRDRRQYLLDIKPTLHRTRWTPPGGLDKLEFPTEVERANRWWERLQKMHTRLTEQAVVLGLPPFLQIDFPLVGEVPEDPTDKGEPRLANGLTPREQEEAYWLRKGIIKKPFAERERERES